MIPEELYKQILENMPILCVDFILVHEGKVLLTYRNDQPAKDQWWIQGGRVFKNETLKDAISRLAQREIGMEVEIINQVGTYEVFFDKGPFEIKSNIHDVAVCFLVKPKGDSNINLDKTHQTYKWIDKIEDNLHSYVKKILTDSKVFSQSQKY